MHVDLRPVAFMTRARGIICVHISMCLCAYVPLLCVYATNGTPALKAERDAAMGCYRQLAPGIGESAEAGHDWINRKVIFWARLGCTPC